MDLEWDRGKAEVNLSNDTNRRPSPRSGQPWQIDRGPDEAQHPVSGAKDRDFRARTYGSTGGDTMQCQAQVLVGVLVFLSGVAPGRADALHEAVLASDAKAVSSLLAASADVNALDALGTPLHMAALTGNAVVASLLIDAGADIEAVMPPKLSGRCTQRHDPARWPWRHFLSPGRPTSARAMLLAGRH